MYMKYVQAINLIKKENATCCSVPNGKFPSHKPFYAILIAVFSK